jgi:hypothetical protein
MIKGQDVIILLLLRLRAKQPWTHEALARATGLSTSQCHSAQKRLREAHLLGQGPNSPWHVPESNCSEFLLHAVKYIFPAKIGSQVRGIPTARSALFVAKLFRGANEMDYVWSAPEGDSKGLSLEPLHPCQIRFTPGKNQDMYEMLVAIDSLRIGRARERNWAEDFIAKKIHESV